jgi:hypothetical protein
MSYYIFNGSIPGVLTTMPHIRLRKKTSLVVLLGVGAAAEVVPVRHRRKVLRRSALAIAVKSGTVPRARKPFALFTKHVWQSLQGGTPRTRMREAGAVWRGLPNIEKQEWAARAKQEYDSQRSAAMVIGVRARKEAGRGVARRRKQPDEVLPEDAGAGQVLAVDSYQCHGGPLGQGTFGLVFRATHQVTGRCVALKLFKNADAAEATREISMHQRIEACGAARRLFSDLLEWSTSGPVPWMAIALAGSSLSQHIRNGTLSCPAVEAIAAQMVLALGCLHRMGLAHLDVKPSNILWSAVDSSARLTDFGTSEPVPVPEKHVLEYGAYCTEPYRPPEIWCASSDHMLRRALSPAIDVWGLGCVVFEALTGTTLMQHPHCAWHRAVQDWVASRNSGARDADIRRSRTQLHLHRVPRDWQAIILVCCTASPSARPTLDSVMDGMAWVLEQRRSQPKLC